MNKDLFGHNYSEEHLKQMLHQHDQNVFYDIEPTWFNDDEDQLEFDFEKEIGIDMQQKVDKVAKMSYTIDNA
jgi:hypothetical protein